jgi:hypothetical protein
MQFCVQNPQGGFLTPMLQLWQSSPNCRFKATAGPHSPPPLTARPQAPSTALLAFLRWELWRVFIGPCSICASCNAVLFCCDLETCYYRDLFKGRDRDIHPYTVSREILEPNKAKNGARTVKSISCAASCQNCPSFGWYTVAGYAKIDRPIDRGYAARNNARL